MSKLGCKLDAEEVLSMLSPRERCARYASDPIS